jgi:glutathione S-transferase
MTESAAICHYLAARYSPGQFNVETHEDDFGAYLNYLHFGEATLTFPQTLILRYARFEPPERRLPQAAEDYAQHRAAIEQNISTVAAPDVTGPF